jgi:hypothetical protein
LRCSGWYGVSSIISRSLFSITWLDRLFYSYLGRIREKINKFREEFAQNLFEQVIVASRISHNNRWLGSIIG